jgi:hypothetical protein
MPNDFSKTKMNVPQWVQEIVDGFDASTKPYNEVEVSDALRIDDSGSQGGEYPREIQSLSHPPSPLRYQVKDEDALALDRNTKNASCWRGLPEK